MQRARALADECQVLEKDIMEAQHKAFTCLDSSSSSKLVRIFVMSSLVQFYALVTLVYRIMPAEKESFGFVGSFSENSVRAARQSVEHHLTSVNMLGSGQFLRKVYVHWWVNNLTRKHHELMCPQDFDVDPFCTSIHSFLPCS